MAEIIQQIEKNNHKYHNSGTTSAYNQLPINNRELPIAVAPNQPPCIKPLNLSGATLETKDVPIGERNNSAIVNINQVPINK